MNVDLSSIWPPAPDDLGNLQAHPNLVRYLAGEHSPSAKEAAAIAALTLAADWAELRARRNQLLAASDWTQLPDSVCDKGAQAAYRQKLRDLPASAATPEKVKWPDAP